MSSFFAGTKQQSGRRTLRRAASNYARLILALLVPLALAGILSALARQEAGRVEASLPPVNALLITPPSNLRIVTLDSSFHVTWNPSSDPLTAWHVVSVWDGPVLQQAKVVGRTGSAAQTNGLVTGHGYTVKVQAMDAQGNLSQPVEQAATTDPQPPLPNAAYFDNFNDAPHGALDKDYYDVRTAELTDPDDPSVSVEQRQVFVSERHWHTMLLMGKGNGSVYVRPRVPFDISNGREGTLQFEMDFPPVQASHGKWAEFNFVKTPPKDGNEFGTDGGDDYENSFNFSLLNGPLQNNHFTFNQARITYNWGGDRARISGTGHVYTPTNVRLPVVIKLSKTSAKMYINGQLAVQASGFTIPWDTGYWVFPQINYSPGKAEHQSDRFGAPPILAAQLIHWETIQFDGPQGSYNPVVKTYLQSGCPGTVNMGRSNIVNCPRVDAPYSYTFIIGGGVSAGQIRSARLVYNGSGDITARINGNQFTAEGGGTWDSLNLADLNPAWFANGQNTFSLVSGSAAQIEVEVIYNQPRVIGNPPIDLVSMMGSVIQSTPGQTNQNLRIEKLTGQQDVQSRTVYLYSQGNALPVAYTAQVTTPGTPWLSVSPAAGVLASPALGGGVTPLQIAVNFSDLRTDHEGVVGLVKVTAPGVHMPLYIAVLAVNDGDSEDLNYITSFSPMITDFEKGAVPGYGGGFRSPTTTPTATTVSGLTSTPENTPSPVSTSTPTGAPTSSGTPSPPATGTRTGTPTALATSAPTNTSTPEQTPTSNPTLTTEPAASATGTPERSATAQSTLTAVSSPTSEETATPHSTSTAVRTASATPVATSTPRSVETPTASPTVLRTPTPAPTYCGASFTDVPDDYWARRYINYLTCNNIVNGYSDGTFRPGNLATRGQLCKIIVLGEGWPIDTSGGPHFRDVRSDNPFYTHIETAYNRGIITGYADGTFKWGNNITRGQLSKVIVLAEGWPADTSGGPHFNDVPTSNPFYAHIETAYNRGIIAGYADGSFRWGNNATRAQIAKIVYLALQD